MKQGFIILACGAVDAVMWREDANGRAGFYGSDLWGMYKSN